VRILHLAESFGGGLMRMVVDLAEGSAAAGDDVLIAHGIRPETPSTLRDDIDDSVAVRALPWTSRTPLAQLRAAREIRALVREWRPDVVHLHSSFGGVVGSLAVGRKVPTVFTPNAFASALPEAGPVSRRADRLAERITCHRVTAVGGVSWSEAEIARELGARRVERIPNGIPELDAGRAVTRPATDPPADPPVIVATGRTVPQRQPDACARVLAAVADVAEVEWLGGGGGSRGEAGKAALEAAGVPITGWLAQRDLLDRMAGATAYLHWTAWDGLPLSVIEAIALDVVVIASDIPPNREILGDSGVRQTEQEAIGALRRVATDPAFAEELRVEQRARRGEFSAAAMVAGWRRLYSELGTGSAAV
jgi:glycosyltransferase involved in cell wall biosynthesis